MRQLLAGGSSEASGQSREAGPCFHSSPPSLRQTASAQQRSPDEFYGETIKYCV